MQLSESRTVSSHVAGFCCRDRLELADISVPQGGLVFSKINVENVEGIAIVNLKYFENNCSNIEN